MSDEPVVTVTQETHMTVTERVEDGFKVVTTTTEVRTPAQDAPYQSNAIGFVAPAESAGAPAAPLA